MSLGGEREELFSGINVTPLTDVMLVLLITFLLSATAFESDTLSVPLPQVKKVSELEKHAVLLTVDSSGEVLWPEGSLRALPLGEALVALRESRDSTTLALALHRDCPYEKFYPLLRSAEGAGWSRLLLLTEEPE